MPDRRIQYLSGDEIDREKWDHCISTSPNGLLYNTSIYLDMLADNWNAVIIDDYKAVMPLPWRKKFIIKYHYHVPFIPQGGMTGEFGDEMYRLLTRTIFRHIRYGDLVFNHANSEYALHIGAVPLVNMVLDLSVEFPHIHKTYHRDLEKNLRRSSRYPLEYSADNNIKLPVALFRKMYASRLPAIRSVDYERFTGLCLHLQKTGNAFVRKVLDERGKLMAVALFLKDQSRIYNIMNAVTPEGRQKSANHFLFDQLIREFAGSGLLLDFEGSQQPGIRKFYENFGAVNQPYYWHRRYPLGFG